MTDKVFWDIIRTCCEHDADESEWHDQLVAHLKKLPPEEIVAFDFLFDEKTDAAYREDLWEAASLINGGASDDGFYYFRCWLVGRGKKAYEGALANPDTLAAVVPEDADDCEAGIYGVARAAWAALGRSEAEYAALYEKLLPPRGEGPLRRAVPTPAGWDTDDLVEVRRRWPKLAARYFDPDEGVEDEDNE